MAEHKFEQETRDMQKSFQDARSASADAYKTGVDLFRKGVERNIAVQKQLLDAAAQQNAESADMWRRMYACIPGAESMLRWTEQAVENLIKMPRRYLDVMEQQNDEIAGSAKSQAERTERGAREMEESRSHRERQKTA